jgi:hypothetical protein
MFGSIAAMEISSDQSTVTATTRWIGLALHDSQHFVEAGS